MFMKPQAVIQAEGLPLIETTATTHSHLSLSNWHIGIGLFLLALGIAVTAIVIYKWKKSSPTPRLAQPAARAPDHSWKMESQQAGFEEASQLPDEHGALWL
eukprot:GEMP01058137.1.p2 GENE.GEMP01058137.1~~GEMP01058137.1.p2  ORF type:complete len:101 (+),score=25.54 GEMP01058137.1:183-485(+)